MADEIAETDEPTVDLLGLPEEDDETPLQKKSWKCWKIIISCWTKLKGFFFFLTYFPPLSSEKQLGLSLVGSV